MVSKKLNPVFTEKESQLMAVITSKGDPNKVMEKAMPAPDKTRLQGFKNDNQVPSQKEGL
jgi:hypothetical protein